MKNREKYDNTRWEKEAELQEASQSNSKDYVNCTYSSYAESTRKLSEAKIDSEASVSDGGSLRYNKGKPEFSHLSPEFILEMCKLMTISAEKYKRQNWVLKQDLRTASDSLFRHYSSFMSGQDNDEGGSEMSHLVHIAVNAMIMWQNYNLYGEEVDNRFYKTLKEKLDES